MNLWSPRAFMLCIWPLSTDKCFKWVKNSYLMCLGKVEFCLSIRFLIDLLIFLHSGLSNFQITFESKNKARSRQQMKVAGDHVWISKLSRVVGLITPLSPTCTMKSGDVLQWNIVVISTAIIRQLLVCCGHYARLFTSVGCMHLHFLSRFTLICIWSHIFFKCPREHFMSTCAQLPSVTVNLFLMCRICVSVYRPVFLHASNLQRPL